MATYVLSPGAWLSGSGWHPPVLGNGSLHPPVLGNGSLHPPVLGQGILHPPVLGNSRLHPPVEGNSGASGEGSGERSRHAIEAVLSAGQVWRGTDSQWVYQGGPQALLAQALERSYARIARPTDHRHIPHIEGEVQAAATAVDPGDPLWRWGSEFRVHAVVADLAWRLRVQACKLVLTSDKTVSLDLSAAKTLDHGYFELQIDKVQRAAVEREDRLPEILAQSGDFRVFFRVLLGLDAAASPLLAEVLAVAWQWATPLVMALKNNVAALRPVQRAPSVMPVIATPAHGALPSGHAAMAALTAEILSRLLFDGKAEHRRVQQMDRLARRIAFNRVVAGVHFPIDSAAGYALGLQLAGHFVEWAKGTPAFGPFTHNPDDFGELSETSKKVTPSKQMQAGEKSAPLALLWDAAVREAERGGL